MTRKEVNMSGKIKIRGFVCAAALIFLFAGLSYGQKGSQDPCGGHYVGEGLRAMFLPLCPAPMCDPPIVYNIYNDIPGSFYQYPEDCVFLFSAGHVIVGIDKARAAHRYVEMKFDYTLTPIPNDPCNTLPFFMDGIEGIGINFERAGTFRIKLVNEWIGSWGNDGVHDGLILTAAGARLNFGAMTPGQTAYCDLGVDFALDPELQDTNTYMFNAAAKVYYGILEETGCLGWRVTPIDEHVWVLTYKTTKVKGKTIVTPIWTEHEDFVYQTIRSDTCPHDYNATFYFPFKLILERLP
jgi:hypothetical protein